MAEKKKTESPSKSLIHNRYEVQGDKLRRKNKFCPKCGEGFFLSKHKNRESCGKCHYTEFIKH